MLLFLIMTQASENTTLNPHPDPTVLEFPREAVGETHDILRP